MVELNNFGSTAFAGDTVLDAGAMAELRALDPDGHSQLVDRVLNAYLGALARHRDQFAQAYADAAWEQVARIAHTLKSSSASIGAPGFASLCSEIERRLRAQEHAGLSELLDQFPSAAATVERAVRALVLAPEAPSP